MSNSRYRSTPANSTIGTIANTAGNSAATRSASWTAVCTPASLDKVAPTHRTPTASAGSSAATSRRAASGRRARGGPDSQRLGGHPRHRDGDAEEDHEELRMSQEVAPPADQADD